MILERKFIVHRNNPRKKNITNELIISNQATSSYTLCKNEVNKLFYKACRLLETIEIWLENSIDDEITTEAIQSLHFSLDKVISTIIDDIEELIKTYQITQRRDLFELRDVVTQLQSIADDLIKSYIK